jgi:hypothetical protein
MLRISLKVTTRAGGNQGKLAEQKKLPASLPSAKVYLFVYITSLF